MNLTSQAESFAGLLPSPLLPSRSLRRAHPLIQPLDINHPVAIAVVEN
jgi:hypothetical protein